MVISKTVLIVLSSFFCGFVARGIMLAIAERKIAKMRADELEKIKAQAFQNGIHEARMMYNEALEKGQK